MSHQGNDSHLARLLNGISEANDVYFWLGMAESINGRQVKQKFGDNNKDSEVFVVAPSTSPLNPVLVDRFSGQSLQDVRGMREAIERGEAALGSLRSDRDREYQRRDLLLQQKKELDESLRRDREKKNEKENIHEKEKGETCEISHYF
ncbi:uncharacterized protein [Porites lutea]|uniref:uncharacterized protein n=1 Tax=Porites lutea TaxID=51062 RepID=UPI003CC6B0FD